VLAGVGLLSYAGYLISRAAERPPILSLGVVIVAVRFFGLARPLARYFERLTSHDLAFRLLARLRVAFFTRLEPLVPSRLEGYRRGDLLARMVGDVEALQNLFLRGVTPPLVALLAGAVSVAVCAAYLPAAGAVLAAGLLTGGVAVPALAATAGRRFGARQANARAELTVELVELLRGAPELVVLGADQAALARVAALDGELARLAGREALTSGFVEGLAATVSGLTVAGVLAVCVAATAAGTLDRVMVATLALLCLASFEAVAPLPAAALRLRATLDSGRRLLALAGREPAVLDPVAPQALSPASDLALERASFAYADEESWDLSGLDLRLAPGQRVALVGRWAVSTCATCASATCGPGSPSTRRTPISSRPPSARTCAWRDPRRATPTSSRPCGARRSGSGRAACPTAWTPSSARRATPSRAASAAASPWRGRSWQTLR
jgi:ABC-type transport system involved in cytochrome bd biosynthesis fused ATPase/permease subunit